MGTDGASSIWGIVVVVGPILLAAVILWAIVKNRASSKQSIAHTEQATRDARKATAAEERARGDV